MMLLLTRKRTYLAVPQLLDNVAENLPILVAQLPESNYFVTLFQSIIISYFKTDICGFVKEPIQLVL